VYRTCRCIGHKLTTCTLPLRVLAAACTMRNEALRDVMGALRDVTERYVHFASVNCSTVTFLPIALKPSINFELEYIVGKSMKRGFQRCIVRTEILSTLHVRVGYISVTKYATETIGPTEANDPRIHIVPLRHVDPRLIRECLG